MKKGEAMGNSIFYSGFHRYLPFLMFVVIYSITCLLGAALFLIEYTYFIRLYEYFSGTPVPMLEPGQKWVALNLLLVAPALMGIGYAVTTSNSFLSHLQRLPALNLGKSDIHAGVVWGAFSISVFFSAYALYQGEALAKISGWRDYASYVASRWELISSFGYFDFVNIYIFLPLLSVWVLLLVLNKAQRVPIFFLVTSFVLLCNFLLFQKKPLIAALIIMASAMYLYVLRQNGKIRRNLVLGSATLCGVLYFGLVILPVYSDTSRTVTEADELIDKSSKSWVGDTESAVPPSEHSKNGMEQRRIDNKKRLTAIADELGLGETRAFDVALYALMAPVTRTSASALYYPVIFPEHRAFYGLDLGQDILGFGQMPDDTIVVWRHMNPDIPGSTAAPFQFVLYSQIGLVGALAGSLLIGLGIGCAWSLSQSLAPIVLKALSGSGVVLLAVYIAVDSLRNSVTASYGIMWFFMMLFFVWAVGQCSSMLIGKLSPASK